MKKRDHNMSELWAVVETLLNQKNLPKKYKDHPLTGNYIGSRDCHIHLDWVLIYTKSDKMLTLERTGSHSDLF